MDRDRAFRLAYDDIANWASSFTLGVCSLATLKLALDTLRLRIEYADAERSSEPSPEINRLEGRPSRRQDEEA